MRFTILQDKAVWWIRDNEHAQYRLPERAVAINFVTKTRALMVCHLLNQEWQEFLKHPV